ncbi:hypothetical protein ACFX1X_003587 [Malus domestica]
MVMTPTSQFNPIIKEMLHFMEDDSTSIMHEATKQPLTVFRELIVPEISMVSEVTSPRAPQTVSRANPPAFPKAAVTT